MAELLRKDEKSPLFLERKRGRKAFGSWFYMLESVTGTSLRFSSKVIGWMVSLV